jgi:NAD(P)-dependent dehydrogenase (short-subunit alcohol dehydrogenase family)
MANSYFAADSSEFGSFATNGADSMLGGGAGAGAASGGGVTIVNWWEMALLAAGPALAFLYALSAALFLPGWGECSFTDVFPSLMPRNSLLILAVAFSVNRSKNEPEEQGFRLLVAVCISGAASLYLLQQTRLYQIEGGPGPQTAANKAGASGAGNKLEGKVMVVTGANAGIGKETARQLYWSGATVILACRSLERAAAARDDIISIPPSSHSISDDTTDSSGITIADENTPLQVKQSAAGKVEIQALDLSSLASVRQAAKELLKKFKTIDVLINNAGVMMDQQTVTSDGYDLTMQANYLGHYLLTRLLLPSIQKSQDPRIINVTSSTYTLASNIDLDDLFCQKGKRKYTLFGQYSQSKLAQILFTNELNVRYGLDGGDGGDGAGKKSQIWTASVHPGLVRTEVVRNLPFWMKAGNAMFSLVLQSLQKTPEQGAWCSVLVATANKDDLPEKGGDYWVNRRTQETLECASSQQDAKALWEMSAKLVGLEN